ncbi:MAG: YARHG domain-containing protein [Bacteroidales bacterium]|nr:YARHG domain-containing protein [Bacteroidales bacterium]
MKSLIVLFVVVFVYLNSIAQSDIKPWITSNRVDYAGVYHIERNDFRIFITDDDVFMQISFIGWVDHETVATLFENVENVNITDNVLTSDNISGEFVTYQKDGEIIYAFSCKNCNDEIIVDQMNYDLYVQGLFPEASTSILTENSLIDVPKDELKIMRNEIFARYGYIFISGGKMDTYFREQEWYRPEHENVDEYLTPIEIHNIEVIQKLENK